MLVIGCTVSLMSWGRGRCTQPTPRECCVLPVQPVWNWEHWGGGRHLWLGKESPTPWAVTEGGQSSVGGTVGTPVCLHHRNTQPGCDRQASSQGRASFANPPGVWTACVRNRTASYSHSQLQAYLAWHWQLSKSHSPLWRAVQGLSAVLEEMYSAKVLCRTQSNSWKMPLVLTRQQLSISGS